MCTARSEMRGDCEKMKNALSLPRLATRSVGAPGHPGRRLARRACDQGEPARYNRRVTNRDPTLGFPGAPAPAGDVQGPSGKCGRGGTRTFGRKMEMLDFELAEQLRNRDRQGRAAALLAYVRAHGEAYYDESVTQLAHALQAAELARAAGAPASLITAALLHDLGHLLLQAPPTEQKLLADDLNHEHVAADYLAPFFPEEVTEPIRLHVPAKRYLCATDPHYHACLSEASQRSLLVQGGPFEARERQEFARHPNLDAALQLRRWDDAAKVVGAELPDLESFAEAVAASLRE